MPQPTSGASLKQRNPVSRNHPASVIPSWVASIALAAVACHSITQAQSIEVIGLLPGGTANQVMSVSGDGNTIVGFQWGTQPDRGFIYRPGGSLTDIGTAPGANATWPGAVSLDGSTVVGYSWEKLTFHGFKYSNGSMELLPGLDAENSRSFASGVSHDGRYIAGGAVVGGEGRAVRWTPTGPENLGVLPDHYESMGMAISANGKVVGGAQFGSGPDTAFLWREGVGSEALPRFTPDDYASVNSLNASGSIAVGFSGNQAAVWRNGTVRSLEGLPGGTFSVAYTISPDSRVIGGTAYDANFNSSAVIWNDVLGMVDLGDYLQSLGVDVSDWEMYGVAGFSTDGSTLAGYGAYQGENRSFVVRGLSFPAAVPEGSPTACAAVLMALGAIVRHVRRR